MKRLNILITILTFFNFAFAEGLPVKSQSKVLTDQQKQILKKHNQSVFNSGQEFLSSASGLFVDRPVAEYEDTGYLLFYSETEFNSADVKAKLIQNLPQDVTAVIYSSSNDQQDLEALYRFYSSMAPNKDQIKVIYIPNPTKTVMYPNEWGIEEPTEFSPSGFWTRDSLPVPVYQQAGARSVVPVFNKFGTVDARYYHFYEPDQYIADYFMADLIDHNYYFEGGNFMVNAKGVCLTINTDEVQEIPDSIFRQSYGCKKLLRLPYLKGIGHVDESVKFISDDIVVTDDQRYKRILEKEGYSVYLLPRPKRYYETYVNSLLINGVVWVPIFKQASDQKAIAVYESLGLRVVPVDSSLLSNDGVGSVHCITMTYPKTTDFNAMMDYFGVDKIISNSNSTPEVLSKVNQLEKELKEQQRNLLSPNLDKYLDSLYY
jgi:hypothetical protein